MASILKIFWKLFAHSTMIKKLYASQIVNLYAIYQKVN